VHSPISVINCFGIFSQRLLSASGGDAPLAHNKNYLDRIYRINRIKYKRSG